MSACPGWSVRVSLWLVCGPKQIPGPYSHGMRPLFNAALPQHAACLLYFICVKAIPFPFFNFSIRHWWVDVKSTWKEHSFYISIHCERHTNSDSELFLDNVFRKSCTIFGLVVLSEYYCHSIYAYKIHKLLTNRQVKVLLFFSTIKFNRKIYKQYYLFFTPCTI